MRRILILAVIIATFSMLILGMVGFKTFIRFGELEDSRDHLYVVDVDRTSEDEGGLGMVEIAENINYSLLFEIPPRDDGYTALFKPAEGRANYISKENLDHYINHINELESNHTYGRYNLEYTVSSQIVNEVELRFRSRRDIDDRETGLYFNNRHVPFMEGVASNITFFNGSGLENIEVTEPYYWEESFEICYHNCYLIEMNLDYSAKPKPDEGGGFEIWQYVILDEEGELKFVYNVRIDTGILEEWIGAPW